MTKELVISEVDGSKPLKNLQREEFCRIFATDPEFFGCPCDAYLQAFDVDLKKPGHRATASVGATNLLKNSLILARINYFLETRLGFTDADADKQLAFCMQQSADMRVKLAAIREYNALKGRIRAKLDITYTDTSDAELTDELKAIESELTQAQALLDGRRANKSADVPGMPNLTEEQYNASTSQEVIIEHKKKD